MLAASPASGQGKKMLASCAATDLIMLNGPGGARRDIVCMLHQHCLLSFLLEAIIEEAIIEVHCESVHTWLHSDSEFHVAQAVPHSFAL